MRYESSIKKAEVAMERYRSNMEDLFENNGEVMGNVCDKYGRNIRDV